MLRKLIAVLSVLALSITGVAFAAKKKHKPVKTSGTAYAAVTHSTGGFTYLAGDAKDKKFGAGALVYKTKLGSGSQPNTVHVDARKITIFFAKGSLTGKGGADQTQGPNNTSVLKNGTFSLTKGTGAYKGKTLKGTFAGTFNGSAYKYTYKATLKTK